MSDDHAEPTDPLGLFEGYGIEIEYMIVDGGELDVLPVTDQVLKALAGEYVNEAEAGALRWSNELALHVIELKTNGPAPSLDGLADRFQHDVGRIHALLRNHGGRLMPTAMHPWMDPARETRLWPHGQSPIYEAFNRIFDCTGHGWSNLQSMHINLPFANDAEFGRLHAAIRMVLPLLPALAASSPVMDGRATGLLDNRLDVYKDNARRIPSVSGMVIPEPVYTRASYERDLLGKIYRDLAPHDPEGTLRHEWVNARGAIARFDRHAVEIRVLDTQECPAADLALAVLVTETVRALTAEAWCSLRTQQDWDSKNLRQVFGDCVRDAERATIEDRRLLAAFGFPERAPARAGDLWQHLIESVAPRHTDAASAFYRTYLRQGTLARRILRALDLDSERRPAAGGSGKPLARDRLLEVYARLCDCLERGELFSA